MSTYKYPESKVIDEIVFRKTEGGHNYAYLHANASADPNALNEILKSCVSQGWKCTPYSIGGKATLEVEGMRRPTDFIKFIETKQWANGPKQYTASKDDHLSFKEQVKKRSLAASGAFYLIGDAAFAKYGYEGGSLLNTVAGGLYGAGTLSLLIFGRKDQSDLQVRDIAKKMANYMKQSGADISSDCSLEAIVSDHKKGLIKTADDLFRRYPSEMMNLFFAGAGACIAAEAYKGRNHLPEMDAIEDVVTRKTKDIQKQMPGALLSQEQTDALHAEVSQSMQVNHKRESWLDVGLGGMTGISGLFAMTTKEKAKDPDQPDKQGVAAIKEMIQRKPLAIAGVGYMVSTLCHAVSTTIAWNHAGSKKRKSVPFRAIFVGANLVAEVLLAISSKGHGEGVKSDKSVDNTIISLAAEAIVKQPLSKQEMLIEHIGRLLGHPDMLAVEDKNEAQLLRIQVEAMRNNPWAMAACHPAAAPAAAPVQHAAGRNTPAPLPAAWQAKHAAAEASKTQPQLSV